MVEIHKALGHENRLAILALLLDQPLCVCDFEENLNMLQSNISRHLIVLKNAKIVTSFKTQQWVYYAINKEFMTKYPLLWQHLQHTLDEEPYKTIREQFSAASSCAGPLPVELMKYRLETENL